MSIDDFKQLVSRVTEQYYSDFSAKRLKEWMDEKQRLGMRGEMPGEAEFTAEARFHVDLLECRGRAVKMALDDTFPDCDLADSEHLTGELKRFVESELIPESCCSPWPSQYEAPVDSRESHDSMASYKLRVTRKAALALANNIIDLHCQKLRKRVQAQNTQFSIANSVIGQMNVAGDSILSPSLNITIGELRRRIEDSDSPEEDRNTALAALDNLLGHPLVVGILSAAVGVFGAGAV